MDPDRQTKPRVPLPVRLAVVLLEVIALGSLAFAGLLVLAAAILGLGTDTIALVLITCVVLAAAAVPAGVGLWRGRAWGWAIALAIAIVGLIAIATVALNGGFQPELFVAVALFGGLAACLFTPTVRTRSGIG